MRRFTAVFTVKRSDKSNAGSIHSANNPSLLTESGNSSASSSSGSASLFPPTPDEDNQNHHLNVVDSTASNKKTWKSWFKASTSSRPKQPPRSPVPEWKPSKLGWDDSQDDPESVVSPRTDDASVGPATLSPLETFETLVNNSLMPCPSPPSPFIHAPCLFPRSVNRPHTLTPCQNLHVTTLKKRLRGRLTNTQHTLSEIDHVLLRSLASKQIQARAPVTQPLDPWIDLLPDSTAVISYSSPGIQRWLDRPCFEERYFNYTPNEEGGIAIRSVTSSFAVAALEFSEGIESMANADFSTYSVPLSSPSVLETPSLTPDIRSTSPSSSPALSIVVPAPPSLPSDHTPPPSSPEVYPAPSPISGAIITPAEPLVKRGVRFAEEDDKDEVVPIGYVLRKKKRREEKARFLKAENERRSAIVEERRQLEAERLRREQERVAWEQERKAWEQEKRAIEEKKQRMYAEQVIAARLRSESQRAGGIPALMASNTESLPPAGPSFHTSASSSVSERNRSTTARRQSKQMWDDNSLAPRPEGSLSNLSLNSRPSTLPVPLPIPFHPNNGSSGSLGSSRPSSFRGTPPASSNPGTPTFFVSHSPYSSHHGSSSEDVRAAAAAQRKTKRSSLSPSITPSFSRNNSSTSLVSGAVSYPTVWTGSHPSLAMGFPPTMTMPTMMPVGYTMMDMPLLPPTAPFMMQQYPKQRGSSPARHSGSGSGSSKGHMSSRESSRERDASAGPNRSGHPSRSASFPDRPAPHHASSSPAAMSRPGNGRVPSGDARRASAPVSPPHQNHYPQRPAQPQHTRSQPSQSSRSARRSSTMPFDAPPMPSPWTGVPTQSGNLPNANVVMKQSKSTSARKSMIT